MARVNNELVIERMPWHSTMTASNHLGAALIAKPEIFEGKMTQLFTTKKYSSNPVNAMLYGGKSVKSINSLSWEWQLRGATTRPLVVIENILPSAVTSPGKGGILFPIKLSDNWWVAGDYIHPGNPAYQCRIKEVVGRQGAGTVYMLQFAGKGATGALPLKFLKKGQKWAKLYAKYGEADQESGSTQYFLPQRLKSHMSRLRKHYKVTGDVVNEVLAVAIPDSNGTMHKTWVKYAEIEYWAQWYQELELNDWYSRLTSDVVKAANGNPVNSGPGIQQLLESSQRHFYNTLTTTLIEEYLMDVFYTRVAPGGQRKQKGFTGEYGMLGFHRAVTDKFKNSGFITVDSNFVTRVSSEYTSNGLSFGGQFTRYVMANGAELELIHNPSYDNPDVHFDMDPVTNRPNESMRITFLNFAGEGTSSNVVKMEKRNGFKMGYIDGLTNPYGPNTSGRIVHAGDYYEMHVAKECGTHIEDVSGCGELILQRAA